MTFRFHRVLKLKKVEKREMQDRNEINKYT